MTIRLFPSAMGENVKAALAAEAEREGIYFVRVSRAVADAMTDWSEPVQVRFELDPVREGEGTLVVRRIGT